MIGGRREPAMLFPLTVAPEDVPAIPGLSYRQEYITSADEEQLVRAVDDEPWDTKWERRRQLYGVSYGSSSEPVAPIPAWGRALAERMLTEGISERLFDQMLVNEYEPGQGIAMHRDYSPFDRTVVSLSLLSPCVMDFRQPERDRKASLLLEPRSLLILTDEARYDWQHGIARRKKDRWHDVPLVRGRRLSITFRMLKLTP